MSKMTQKTNQKKEPQKGDGWLRAEPKWNPPPAEEAKKGAKDKKKQPDNEDLEIKEQMLDISDGDYLLESLREFKPPA